MTAQEIAGRCASIVFLFSNSLSVPLGFLSLCLGALIIYRLWLTPVAKFPGPKIAALTFFYEFYYDAWQEGQYTWKIRDLHKKYGRLSSNVNRLYKPTVRI